MNISDISYEEVLSWWQAQQIQTEAELSAALNSHSISFAYHSGRIENERITYNDTREIFEHDSVTSYTGDLRTLFEIRNARDAGEFFLRSFGLRRPLDEPLLLEMQRLLTLNTYDTRRWQLGERPGTYKLHDYVIGRGEVGASPEDTAEEVSELLDELQELPDEHALTGGSYFHAKIENIHPFADGNGRTGRLAMNYLLVLHGHPPITVHEEDRKEYYSALEAWDSGQELNPLKEFLKRQTIKTWAKRASTGKGACRQEGAR